MSESEWNRACDKVVTKILEERTVPIPDAGHAAVAVAAVLRERVVWVFRDPGGQSYMTTKPPRPLYREHKCQKCGYQELSEFQAEDYSTLNREVARMLGLAPGEARAVALTLLEERLP